MGSVKRDIYDLTRKIGKTPGFTVQMTNGNYRVTNDSTQEVTNIHTTPSDHRYMENNLANLKATVGWEMSLYETAQRKDREARMAAHDAMFREPAFGDFGNTISVNGRESMPSTNDAIDLDGTDIAEIIQNLFTDPTKVEAAYAALAPLFGGMIPKVEYLDLETAEKYFANRLPDDANHPVVINYGITNRRYNSNTALEYGEAMLRGEWMLNPDALKFSPEGFVLDGQTRLGGAIYALKQSPTLRIPFMVFRNVSTALFKVLDTGRKRNSQQMAEMMNVPNYAVAASVVRYVWLWFNVDDQTKWSRWPALTNTQWEQTYKANKERVDYETQRTSTAAGASGLSRAAMVTARFMISHLFPGAEERVYDQDGHIIVPSLLDDFIRDFHTGANMGEGDPVLRTREYARRRKNGDAGHRENAAQKLGFTAVMVDIMFIVRAWNSRVQNKTLKGNVTWQAGNRIPVPLNPAPLLARRRAENPELPG